MTTTDQPDEHMSRESDPPNTEHDETLGRDAMNEEEIHAMWVIAPTPLVSHIHLEDYNPDWQKLFQREAVRIQATLREQVLTIEHVGSTSVPRLAAKPRIDILLVIPNSADESTYVPALEAAGYRLVIREPGWYEHRVFKGPDTDINLHTISQGCPEIEKMLLFRDWLRSHSDDRELYEQTKRDLARRDWMYTQQYADAKTEVVEAILARARKGTIE